MKIQCWIVLLGLLPVFSAHAQVHVTDTVLKDRIILDRVQPPAQSNPARSIHICTPSRGELISQSPLYIVDGIKAASNADLLSTLNPQHIQTITVLRSDSAIAAYGEEAKYGVVIIKTKPGTQRKAAPKPASSRH